MKVLVVSNMYPSQSDPTYGTFIEIFCDGLIRHGISVDLVVIRGRSSPAKRTAKYILAISKLVFQYLFGHQEIVYVHFPLHFAPVLWALSLLRTRKIILNAHGNDVNARPGFHQLLLYFFARLAHRSNAIVVPSNSFRTLTLAAFKNLHVPIFVWPSGGVDTDLFMPSIREHSASNPIHLVYVSRLLPMKGFEHFINALGILRNKFNVELKVSFIGHGSNSQVDKFHKLISHWNLERSCSYLGAMTHNQLASFLPNCDAMVFPTCYQESLGLVALEAMACGIPVLGSKIGALPEYIIEDSTGHLFEANNPDSIVAAILRFINRTGSSQKQCYSYLCRKMAEKYSRQLIEPQIAKFLASVAETPIQGPT